jgi:hypothetical protein
MTRFFLVKTAIISFTRKTNNSYFNYKSCNNLITGWNCELVKSELPNSKRYFHQHTDCILSQGLQMLFS